MIPAWAKYWKRKADEAEFAAHRMREYPELADEYQEEADDIRGTFLADAVIVEDAANPTIAGWDSLNLSELEKRYLDGDR